MSLYLIARIAEQAIAIAADRVESVVEIEAVSPVPGAPDHVAGLTALRSRVLTLIDTRATLGLPRQPLRGLDPAIVVVIDGHLYGLLVDAVDDVAMIEEEPRPAPGSLAGGWAAVARGIVERDGAALLLVDPGGLAAGTVAEAA